MYAQTIYITQVRHTNLLIRSRSIFWRLLNIYQAYTLANVSFHSFRRSIGQTSICRIDRPLIKNLPPKAGSIPVFSGGFLYAPMIRGKRQAAE